MSAEVLNNAIKSSLLAHLKGKSNVAVNFTFGIESVTLQSVSDYIYENIVPLKYSGTSMEGMSVSIVVDSSINLLQDNKDMTSITSMGKTLVFSQGSLVFPFMTCYDEYLEVTLKSREDVGAVSLSELSGIASMHRSLTNVSKSLDIAPPPVIINNSRAYVMYSNVIIIKKVSLNLPNFEVPYSTYNNVVKGMSGTSLTMSIDSKSGMILVNRGLDVKSYFNFKSPNSERINAVLNKIDSLEYVGVFNVSSLDCIKELDKCYPKESLSLSFYDDESVGCLITITDGKTIKVNSKDVLSLININISTSQFGSILRVFNNSPIIEVFKGDDIVCLKNRDQSKILLLSGMTF